MRNYNPSGPHSLESDHRNVLDNLEANQKRPGPVFLPSISARKSQFYWSHDDNNDYVTRKKLNVHVILAITTGSTAMDAVVVTVLAPV